MQSRFFWEFFKASNSCFPRTSSQLFLSFCEGTFMGRGCGWVATLNGRWTQRVSRKMEREKTLAPFTTSAWGLEKASYGFRGQNVER